MLKAEKFNSYSRHIDYYQLWLDKKKENQYLINNFLHSKKVIKSLHLKLTDILSSIKSLEAHQETISLNNQEHETSEGTHFDVPVNSQNNSTEIQAQHIVPQESSEFVEMVFEQEVTAETGYNSKPSECPSIPLVEASSQSDLAVKPKETRARIKQSSFVKQTSNSSSLLTSSYVQEELVASSAELTVKSVCPTVNEIECVKVEPVEELAVAAEVVLNTSTESVPENAVQISEIVEEVPSQSNSWTGTTANDMWQIVECSTDPNDLTAEDRSDCFIISDGQSSSFTKQVDQGPANSDVISSVSSETSHNLSFNVVTIEDTGNEMAEENGKNKAGPIWKRTRMSYQREKQKTASFNLGSLRRVESGEKQRTIANQLQVGQSKGSQWLTNREKIEQWCRKPSSAADIARRHDTKTASRNTKLEEALFLWYTEMNNKGEHLSGINLQHKARDLNKQMNGDPNFTASLGWLDRWKKRHAIPQARYARRSDLLFANYEGVSPTQENLQHNFHISSLS